MCLSVAVNRPNDVLATGMHAGHQWAVVHNGRSYRARVRPQAYVEAECRRLCEQAASANVSPPGT